VASTERSGHAGTDRSGSSKRATAARRWSTVLDRGASQLQTPGLSGEFQLEVTAIVGPNPEWQTLGPTEGSQPGVIGCNENCASMIGIVVDPNDPSKAYYWTTWDAFCS
jgi:hypothetical protein